MIRGAAAGDGGARLEAVGQGRGCSAGAQNGAGREQDCAQAPEPVPAVAEAERVFLTTLPLETTKVDPFLVASTAHLSDAEQRRLAAPVPSIPQPFILVAPAVHGAVLYLDADAVIVPGVLSAGAEALARYMQRHGFDYVYLDADVEPVVGVPVSESHAA